MRQVRRMTSGFLLFLAVLSTVYTSTATAADVLEDLWYSIDIAGGRVGWQHSYVHVDGDERISKVTMEMALKRGQMSIEVAIESSWTSTVSGKPISAKMIQDMSMAKTIAKWTFQPDGIKILETSGGPPVTREVPLPDERWLLPYDAQKYFHERAKAGAQEISVKMMSPEIGPEVITVTYTRLRDEAMQVGDRTIPTTVWKMVNSATPQVPSTMWYSSDGVLVANETDLGFGVLRQKLSNKSEALQEPDAAPEVFYKLMVEPDQPIDDPWKARRVVMKVRTTDSTPLDLPSVGYQSIAGKSDDELTIVVDMDAPQPATAEEIVDEAYLGQSVMIDPQDEEIIRLRDQALSEVVDQSPIIRAEALRAFVLRYIEKKDLGTAFASSSEVARNRTGDCSEHGVLLAALLRSEGIPSRVVTGLVYVPGIGEQGQGAFGWHMWTQALIDGQWLDLDATLPVSFSGGHITTNTSALSQGTGSADMSGLVSLLGKIDIDVVRVDHE